MVGCTAQGVNLDLGCGTHLACRELLTLAALPDMSRTGLSHLPNMITLARVALVPVLILLLKEQDYTAALIVFVIAGLSDALDGYLAKRLNVQSRLGARRRRPAQRLHSNARPSPHSSPRPRQTGADIAKSRRRVRNACRR